MNTETESYTGYPPLFLSEKLISACRIFVQLPRFTAPQFETRLYKVLLLITALCSSLFPGVSFEIFYTASSLPNNIQPQFTQGCIDFCPTTHNDPIPCKSVKGSTSIHFSFYQISLKTIDIGNPVASYSRYTLDSPPPSTGLWGLKRHGTCSAFNRRVSADYVIDCNKET